MKASERALNFAIKAHEGEFRKEEKDRPYVLHPMIVGDILKYYEFDDNVVAAGYLHDVVENTNYTIEDLSLLFRENDGGDITSLVMTATYPEGLEDWKEKRKIKIKNCKDLPIRNKAVILADQIANIEERRIVAEKQGYLDFSKFHGNFEDQKWYNEGMLESLAANTEDTRLLPLLDRLYNNIQILFYNQELDYLKKPYFYNENFKHSQIKKLNAQKEELGNLRNLLQSPKPFVIEFSNENYKEQDSFIKICLDFFKDDGYKIKVLDGHSYIGKYEKKYIQDKKGLSLGERNLLITYEIASNLLSELSNNQDIIILDEGLFNRLTWMHRLLKQNKITVEEFKRYANFYLPQINSLINFTIFSYSKPKSYLQNDEEYNAVLNCCQYLLNGYNLFSDSKLDEPRSNYRVLENLLPIMRNDYIKQLKLMLDKKGQE